MQTTNKHMHSLAGRKTAEEASRCCKTIKFKTTIPSKL